jgi:NAD+ diphosphatase
LSIQDAQRFLADAESLVLLGEDDTGTHFALGFPYEGGPPPPALTRYGRFCRLREVVPLIDAKSATVLAYAKAMVHYHHQHRYCARCGAPTVSAEAGHLRVCTDEACGRQDFPRTDPAIIVLVTSGDRCLLGRQASWTDHTYSIIAGFVEPGETLEGAVARELREETGILVTDVTYHSSQPWPFPRSLMIGFNATAASTEICLRDGELEDARWFSRRDIVRGLSAGSLRLPSAISISRRLIARWFEAGGEMSLREIRRRR